MMWTWLTLARPILAARAVLGGALIGLAIPAFAPPAYAAGDLLIAPTRVILDGRRGTEVILNNIGDEEATYRITLELRRMNDQGRLDDVDAVAANDKEKSALDVIRYAPRRVTLPPNQPQSIRIGLQAIDALPDGEYRAHMLFRAIPKTPAADGTTDAGNSLRIQLIPIYGISIPVIVRKGNLQGTAALTNVRIGKDNEGPTLEFDMARQGNKSIFGEIHVTKPGQSEPISVAKGIAIYPEITSRIVSLPLTPDVAAKMRGEVVISYYEAPEAGGGLIAQVRTVLP
ncbi:fimbrial biogenesis chaperone [Sphingorhabdus profundilacus]|jgi:P pilus assembly chaperone PapD|uniref:fimbrial biogenesis chaperone n=1 Tax=Sphingorhabdus profundilacus TaxID=2509718 RepID=UPI001FE9A075|nr:molecular chaperone [Sphingorhabdus profundilacus]